MHTYFHTTFGFCLWDLLALIVLIAIVVVLAVHVANQRKRQKEFEKEMKQRQAGGSTTTYHGRPPGRRHAEAPGPWPGAFALQSGKTHKMFSEQVQTYMHGQQTFAKPLDTALFRYKMGVTCSRAHNGVGAQGRAVRRLWPPHFCWIPRIGYPGKFC